MSRRIYIYSGGIRVAKPGKDATSGAYDDLLFDSTRRVTRAYMSGFLPDSFTVTHNLGYVPVVFCCMASATTPDLSGYWYNSQFTINTTQLIFTSGGGTQASYVIFYDRWV